MDVNSKKVEPASGSILSILTQSHKDKKSEDDSK